MTLDNLLLVINKFEKNSILTISKLRKSLEMEVATTISFDRETVLLANNLGRPFVLDYPNFPISQEIGTLANMIIRGKIPRKPTTLVNAYRKIRDGFNF